MKITIALAALSVPLVVAACGGGGDNGTTTSASPEATSMSEGATGTTEASFDQAFIDAMVAHHQQAIEMAQAAKDAGLSQPELEQIADDTIANQQTEIDQMLEWRMSWFGSDQIDPNPGDTLGMSMEDMGMTDDPAAIGSSDDVDAMFATMMMDHHNGAIQMAEMALDQAEHSELKDLAQQIIDAQQAEIETMMPFSGGDMGGMDM